MAQSNDKNEMKIIGIFGGTFDPIHQGHIQCLVTLDKQINFERVHWVLSAQPPHKRQPTADIEHRFEMLKLVLNDYPQYVADDTEIKRQQESYTLHTLQHFREQYPDESLCLIIGGDSLEQIETWYHYQELTELANIVVMSRPGYQPSLPAFLEGKLIDNANALANTAAGKVLLVNNTDFDVSSTEIRKRLNTKQTVEDLLPATIQDYIHQHELYQAMNSDQIKDQVVDALEDVKGVDINVMDIADISDFADYMIVASGTSDTHVKALARSASDQLRQAGVKPLNENGADIGEWILVDFGDVVLHVMRPEVRDYYELEKFWDEDVRELVNKHRAQQE